MPVAASSADLADDFLAQFQVQSVSFVLFLSWLTVHDFHAQFQVQLARCFAQPALQVGGRCCCCAWPSCWVHIVVCKRSPRIRAGVTVVAAGAAGLDTAHAVPVCSQCCGQPSTCLLALPLCLQVVVATDTSLAESIRIDEFCHANGIAFIKVLAAGAVSTAADALHADPVADALHADPVADALHTLL